MNERHAPTSSIPGAFTESCNQSPTFYVSFFSLNRGKFVSNHAHGEKRPADTQPRHEICMPCVCPSVIIAKAYQKLLAETVNLGPAGTSGG